MHHEKAIGGRTANGRAVFLDRDGVIVPDDDFLVDVSKVRLLDGVPQALRRLDAAGVALVVITNQPIIARGLATEDEIVTINEAIRTRIEQSGGPANIRFYFCPHHPHANVEAYRVDCDCRKPKPGLLRRAAAEQGLDLQQSFMIGDRITDIVAGAAAGCKTVMVLSGRHLDPTIVTSVPIDASMKADHVCADLSAAAEWILTR